MGLDADMQAKLMSKNFVSLQQTIDADLECFRKPRAAQQVVVIGGGGATATVGASMSTEPPQAATMDLDALRY